ncbi:MAG TPA: diguanylate cyclase [Thermoanaerobaculia bacterium]|nr:diguanylate cyclase [Thermoanaerobaculia bacterium]
MPKFRSNRVPRRLAVVAAVFLAVALQGVRASGEPSPAGAKAPPFLGRFTFRTYAQEEGLTDTSVECVLQDHVGYLWAGTDDGLFRFDGRQFKRYSREQGLPRTRIYQIHQTADGRMYAATGAGLARLAGNRFVVLDEKAGLGPFAVSHEGVDSDAAGTVYVGTDHGLFVGKNDRFEPDREANALGEGPVGGVHLDAAGALYFTRGGLLFRQESGRVVEFGRPRGLPSGETLDDVATDAEGRVWVRTVKHLYLLARGAQRFERDDDGLPESSEVGRLDFDDRGQLLIPTVQGLAYKEKGAWRIIGRREGLASDAALSALVDREGSLWVGLLGGGLDRRLGRGEFTNWTRSDGLAQEVVWAVARQKTKDGAGPIWVGTEQGLDRIDAKSGEVRRAGESEGLAGNSIAALEAAEDGSVWVGSWPGGVTRILPDGRMRRYAAADAPPERFRVAAIHVRPDGEVWVGAVEGLYRLAAGSSSTTLEHASVGRDRPDGVRAFAEDSAGTLYAASRQGIVRVTGDSPRVFSARDGLKEDWISSIAFAADGSAVVAYRESIGAARVVLEGDRLTVRPIDTETGLVSNKVVLLGRDASGALWIGTGTGADVYGPDWKHTARYGRPAGMVSDDLDQNAFLAEPDGTVWLGSSRGLIRFQAGTTPAPEPPPPIVITSAMAGTRQIELDPSRPVVLDSSDRNFSVSWAGLTFLEPRRVRYRHRMLGLVDQYTETELTEARFPALPTGSYRFEVLCVAADGKVSRTPAVVQLQVRAAWWETGWARLLWALLAAAALVAVVRWRTRHLEAERRRLEEAVAARSAELAAANRELREASFTDALTGARNRRFFSTVIEDDVNRTLRVHSTPAQNRPRNCDLIFYIVDIDHFKEINDEFGHDRGDGVLAEVARRLTGVVRDSDRLIRWGGEEFLLISRDADRTRGDVLAGRVMQSVGSEPFDLGGGHKVRRTCSVGWAPFPWYPDSTRTFAFTEVLKLADRAMYLAKQSGRNRSVGALPAGPYSEIGARNGEWWEKPLNDAEGSAVTLVKTGGPVVVTED